MCVCVCVPVDEARDCGNLPEGGRDDKCERGRDEAPEGGRDEAPEGGRDPT